MDSRDKKERAAYYTAILSFVVGWGLTIAGFIVAPTGEVSNSVLAILGEAMVYAASVFGVTLYFSNQMEKFKTDAKRYMDANASRRDYSREETSSEYMREAEEYMDR